MSVLMYNLGGQKVKQYNLTREKHRKGTRGVEDQVRNKQVQTYRNA